MACFLTPATAAIITTSIRKKIPPKYHLEWLNAMLWGGVIMLLIEHIANGEIVLYPPFLTALQNPADIPMMLEELVIGGGVMTIAVIVVWITLVLIANSLAKIRKRDLLQNLEKN